MRAQKFTNAVLVLVSAGVVAIAPASSLRAQTGAKTAPQSTAVSEVKHDAAETARAIKNYTVEQKDEAVKKAREALDDMDARIDRLQARLDKKWTQMTQAAREKAQATERGLRKERTQAAEWYGGLKHSSANAWGDVKSGFVKSYEALADAIHKAEREY
jgi:small-conductance mechanosensitive channel